MKTKTELSAFTFRFKGNGHYQVTYLSPVTGKEFTKLITDMTIIDATKNEDEPKRCDLDNLKRICKIN